MKVPGIHPPDPDDPKGMAFIFAAGFVDPRKGGKPNQMLVLKESWEPTSAMYWALASLPPRSGYEVGRRRWPVHARYVGG